MKRIIQQLFCLVLMVSGLGFHACQQGDEADLDKMAKKSGTRAEGDIICEIEAKEPGKLDSLINVFVKGTGYSRESINILSLKGPLNPTDISTICGFQYLDSLNMEKVTMMTAEGDTTTVFDGFGNKFGNPNAAVVLPEMLTEIGDYALSGTKMRTAILCEGVTKIGERTFQGSTVLSVVCPKSLSEMGMCAFRECKSLAEISLDDTQIKELPVCIFQSCDKLAMVKLPPTLVTIKRGAFQGCSELKEVDIPSYVREIESEVFDRCAKLERVTWPSRVTNIPSDTFHGCSLMKTEIPDWVVSIGANAFDGCKASESFTVPARVKSIGYGAFSNQDIVSVILEDGVPLSGSMFRGCSKLENITLPSDATAIPEFFLLDCKSLKTIDLPKSVTSIGNYAFSKTNLKEIQLNEGLRTIGGYVFEYTALETLTIPSTVTQCGSSLVSYCPHITAIFWNSLAQAPDLIQDKERNLLVYLPAGGSSVKENSNQIVNGHALNIYLTEDGDFKCPKEFKADKIYFTKDFSWDWDWWNKPFTAPGKSAGWLTMALPFTVSKIYTEEDNPRVLAPFNAEVADSKPFWLRELTSEGFKNVTKIEADKPYLIAMPYNDNYLPEYNIRCKVTFMGENVTIPVTTNPATVTGPEYDFTPNYHDLGQVADKLTTNKKAYHHTPTGKGYEAGSIFLADESQIHAFDAYITAHKANTRLIEIVPSAGTRSVKKIGKVPSIDDM